MPVYALGDDVPDIHDTAYIHPDAVVIGDVRIGREASVWPSAVLRGDYGSIRIGARTSIQDGTVVHTAKAWPTVIGDDCVVGHSAHLEGCTVEDRCLVGSGSITLNGVRVGTGSVIAAGAVLTEGSEMPAKSIAVGMPARFRPLERDTAWVQDGVATYVENARRYRRSLRRVG